MFYSRWTSFIGMLVCVGLLAFAAYLQVHLALMPCPLCVIQRIFIALLALVFLVGSLYTPTERATQRIHSGLIITFSALGALFAARHSWLTMQPPGSVPSCSPTLSYMLQNLPMTQTMKLMFTGSGECTTNVWSFLGLNIPQWTLLFFIVFLLFGIARFYAAKSRRGIA
jgi:protein dithiol:quinone oxidoreductase